jgi:hypothetical protein
MRHLIAPSSMLEVVPTSSQSQKGMRTHLQSLSRSRRDTPSFARLGTTGSKSRLNFLERLRAGHGDYAPGRNITGTSSSLPNRQVVELGTNMLLGRAEAANDYETVRRQRRHLTGNAAVLRNLG